MKSPIDATEAYSKYNTMIHNRVWHYAKKYNQERDELLSAAHEIFCKALKSFNPEKASFGTHLYSNLRRLADTCKSEQTKAARVVSFEDDLNSREDRKIPSFMLEDSAEKELSEDGREVLAAIVSGVLELPGRDFAPTQHRTQTYFKNSHGWKMSKGLKAWNEVQNWWRHFEGELV